uniref:Uncharacterized protein n=1 Tax=Ananas comosus var. bracteatus TaxID=296719 RepID=A0A6V7QXV7_ANACO
MMTRWTRSIRSDNHLELRVNHSPGDGDTSRRPPQPPSPSSSSSSSSSARSRGCPELRDPAVVGGPIPLPAPPRPHALLPSPLLPIHLLLRDVLHFACLSIRRPSPPVTPQPPPVGSEGRSGAGPGNPGVVPDAAVRSWRGVQEGSVGQSARCAWQNSEAATPCAADGVLPCVPSGMHRLVA